MDRVIKTTTSIENSEATINGRKLLFRINRNGDKITDVSVNRLKADAVGPAIYDLNFSTIFSFSDFNQYDDDLVVKILEEIISAVKREELNV